MRQASVKLASFGLCLLACAWAPEARAETPLSCQGPLDLEVPYVWTTRTPDVEDRFTIDDATQAGHLGMTTPAIATCTSPLPAPPVAESTEPFPYRAHTFENRSTSASCVTVLWYAYNDVGPHYWVAPHNSAAYLGSFDPTDIGKNYLSMGPGGGMYEGPKFYSFIVPALTEFVVVMSSDWDTYMMLHHTDYGYRAIDTSLHYALYVGGCEENAAPISDSDAGVCDAATSPSIVRVGDAGMPESEASSANTETDETASVDSHLGSTVPNDAPSSAATSGCAMTPRTASAIAPFALAVGALLALRRRRRD